MRWQLDVHGVSVRLAGCGSIEEVERSSHSRGKRNSSASSNLCYSDRTLLMCTWCRMLTRGDMQDQTETVAFDEEMEDKLRQFARAAIEGHRPTFELLNRRTNQKKYAKK